MRQPTFNKKWVSEKLLNRVKDGIFFLLIKSLIFFLINKILKNWKMKSIDKVKEKIESRHKRLF